MLATAISQTHGAFYAAPQQAWRSPRMLALLFFALTLGAALIRVRLAAGLGFSLFFLLGFGVLWFMRRKTLGVHPWVTLSVAGVQSDRFRGKQKHFAWQAIKRVKVLGERDMRVLRLHLYDHHPSLLARFFGRGYPQLPIGALSQRDQEHLLHNLNFNLHIVAGGSPANAAHQPNPIRAERHFRDKLRSKMPHAWVTYGLIALNAGVWGWTVYLGADMNRASVEQLLSWGGLAASEVQRGEWWRLLTATVLHGSLMHMAMNMLGLYSAGVMLERLYGHRQFALLYLGASLAGSLCSLYFSAQQSVSVGASGAVFGVTGALFWALYHERKRLPRQFSKRTLLQIGIFIAYSLFYGFTHTGIDNAAHVGGLLGGTALASLLPSRMQKRNFQHMGMWGVAGGLLLVLGTTLGLAALAPRAQVDMRAYVAGQGHFSRAMQQFERALHDVQADENAVKAGKMTELQADERTRSVHAPAFLAIKEELAQVVLLPQDPRQAFLLDLRQLISNLQEGFRMASIYDTRSGKLEALDPARAAQLERENKVLLTRIAAHAQQLRKQARR